MYTLAFAVGGLISQSSWAISLKLLSQTGIREEYCANEKTDARMKKASEKTFFIINPFILWMRLS
jgi:hypothetical protein